MISQLQTQLDEWLNVWSLPTLVVMLGGWLLCLILLPLWRSYAKRHRQRLQQSVQRETKMTQALKAQLRNVEGLKQRVKKMSARNRQLHEEIFNWERDYLVLKERHSAEQTHNALLREEVRKEFSSTAEAIMQARTAQANQVQQDALGAILSPLRDELERFKAEVVAQHDTQVRDSERLQSEIAQLRSLNERIGAEAVALTHALKGDNKVQGNWGELVLERLLEEAGLQRGREFTVQSTLNADGRNVRPDVILHLPDQRQIVIDSKVSMVAYERAISAQTDVERQQHIGELLKSVRTHIGQLSRKRYEDIVQINTLDFVLMFVPIEGAFHLALQNDTNLYAWAYEQNIVIVSPTTLLATCRTIQNIWRYEKQNRNAEEIARQASGLLNKFVGFAEDLDRVGDQLERAQRSYQQAQRKLGSGPGNIISRATQLQSLGVATRKALPEELEAMDAESGPNQDNAELE